MAHWEKVWFVLGCDAQGRAMLAGPVEDSDSARKLAAEKIRFDPEWRRAFVLEAPFGYDFHLSPVIPDETEPDQVRHEAFPDLPAMVPGQNDLEHLEAARAKKGRKKS